MRSCSGIVMVLPRRVPLRMSPNAFENAVENDVYERSSLPEEEEECDSSLDNDDVGFSRFGDSEGENPTDGSVSGA